MNNVMIPVNKEALRLILSGALNHPEHAFGCAVRGSLSDPCTCWVRLAADLWRRLEEA